MRKEQEAWTCYSVDELKRKLASLRLHHIKLIFVQVKSAIVVDLSSIHWSNYLTIC